MLWRSADKIVYSHTLEGGSSARTRIEREFDPDAIRVLKRAAVADISIGADDDRAEQQVEFVDQARGQRLAGEL
ncbi:MAG TPA: hypothetical protein VLC49_07055 [Solirubrobacteraceae bacterium]|nr:hypothetical protein [Solirubrobacteraceae bacterium]